jgi:hypothetical protein
MSQPPLSVFLLPEVRGTKLIAQLQKPLWSHADIIHNLLEILLRELTIEPPD